MLPDLTARPRWYVLEGHIPTPATDAVAWAQWFSQHGREAHVATSKVDGAVITTRFTGMDRGVFCDDLPTLFETIVDDGLSKQVRGWSLTWDGAVACHQRVLAERQPPPKASPSHQVWPARAWATLRRAVTRRTAPFSSPLPAAKETPQCPLE